MITINVRIKIMRILNMYYISRSWLYIMIFMVEWLVRHEKCWLVSHI